jgi:ABC-type lipoprotein release transport system permease subunit
MRQREIGIIRALGASASDTMKIFISEGIMIALINLMLGCILLPIVCALGNSLMNWVNTKIEPGTLFGKVFTPGIIPMLTVILLPLLTTMLTVTSPIKKYNKKHPADVIKGL